MHLRWVLSVQCPLRVLALDLVNGAGTPLTHRPNCQRTSGCGLNGGGGEGGREQKDGGAEGWERRTGCQ